MTNSGSTAVRSAEDGFTGYLPDWSGPSAGVQDGLPVSELPQILWEEGVK